MLQIKDPKYLKASETVEKLLKRVLSNYLSSTCKDDRRKTKMGEFSFKYGKSFFKKATLDKLKTEQKNLEDTLRPILCFVLYQIKSNDYLKSQLINNAIPEDLIKIIIKEISNLKNTIALQVEDRNNFTHGNIEIYASAHEKAVKTVVTMTGTGDSDKRLEHKEDTFRILETNEEDDKKAIYDPKQENQIVLPDTSIGSFSALELTAPPDLIKKSEERHDLYAKAGQLKLEGTRQLSLTELEAEFSNLSPYWLLELSSKLAIMVDFHVGFILGHLDFFKEAHQITQSPDSIYSTLINISHPYFTDKFREHKKEFYIIKNAIMNLHERFCLENIPVSYVFDVIVLDIKRALSNYFLDIEAYVNALIASPGSSEDKEIIRDYLDLMLSELYFHTQTQKNENPGIFGILEHRQQELDRRKRLLISYSPLSQKYLIEATKYNADNNTLLFNALSQLTTEGFKGIINLKNKVNKAKFEYAALPAPSEKKNNKHQNKKQSKNRRSKQKFKKKQALTKAQEENQSTPRPIGRLKLQHHLRPTDYSENTAGQTQENWTNVNNKKQSKNRQLIDDAFKKMNEHYYEKAIELFEQILISSKRHDNAYDYCLYGIARCHEEIGNPQKAQAYLNKLSEKWKDDYHYQLMLSRLLIAMGRADKATIILQDMTKKWPNDVKILYCLGQAHEENKEHATAISIFKWLQLQESSINLSITLVYAYIKADKLNEALEILNQLSEEEKKQDLVLIAYTYCYSKLGRFDLSYSYFKQITINQNLKENKLIFKRSITTLRNMNKLNELWNLLQNVPPKWLKDNDILMLFAEFYISKTQYEKALTYLIKILKTNEISKKLLVSLVYCHRKLGKFDKAEYEKAIEYCNLLIKHYPFHLQGYLQLILIKEKLAGANYNEIIKEFQALRNKPEFSNSWSLYSYSIHCMLYDLKNYSLARQEVELAIKKFPYKAIFYKLFIDVLELQGDFVQAFEELNKASKEFPDNPLFYKSKIKLYRLVGKISLAQAITEEAEIKFAGNNKLICSFKKLNKTKPLKNTPYIPQFSSDNTVETMEINLPPIVKAAFVELKRITGEECYLAGGAAKEILVAHLLKRELNEDKFNDLDFSVNIEPEALIKHGFKQSMHKKNLFTFRFQFGPRVIFIDVDIHRYGYDTNDNKHIPLEDAWKKSNAEKRHFTIGAALIGEKEGKGIAYDMLGGRVFKHIKDNILDTCSYYPAISFQADPSQLICAIRYINDGNQPTDEVREAILDWEGGFNIAPNYSHIVALIKKHIQRDVENSLNYVMQLYTFALLLKIFSSPMPNLISEQLSPSDIDQAFVTSFQEALNEQYVQLSSIGFNCLPNQDLLSAEDIPLIISDMYRDETEMTDGQESIEEVQEDPCVFPLSRENWPSLTATTYPAFFTAAPKLEDPEEEKSAEEESTITPKDAKKSRSSKGYK